MMINASTVSIAGGQKAFSGSEIEASTSKPHVTEIDMDPATLEIDYDDSLNLRGIVGELVPDNMTSHLEFLKTLYMQKRTDSLSPLDSPRIPKIIHQIWLGSELPERFKGYQRNWRKIHPDWEYKLWTDREVEDFEFDSADLFHNTDCFGQKSDLLRAEILHRYGGLYIDVDYDCFKRLDIFHHAFDLYGAIRLLPGLYMKWPEVYKSPVLVCGSLLGSVPGHPVLRDYLQRARRNTGDSEIIQLSQKLSPAERRNKDLVPLLIKARLQALTTYIPFFEAFISQQKIDCQRVIAIPPTFFNPIDNWWQSIRFKLPKYWTAAFKSLIKNGYHPYKWKDIPDVAFAVHHSSASWLWKNKISHG